MDAVEAAAATVAAEVTAAAGAAENKLVAEPDRSGEDIIKAYSLGANFVLLGRPLLFAIAANGELGLKQMSHIIETETSIALAQLGICDLQAVTPALIASLN